MVHPTAGVSVKLVSEVGIGTVACGVAKANADVIQVSGHDGGTGASPLSSIKHAGSPWELGLTEVHQSLVENGLREKVTLRVDGGIKTGWDVVLGAAMGAEEFGFGTIAMIASGCVMARVCHLNTCPVGVTTQRMDLREKFPADPEHVVQYFQFVADETRQVWRPSAFSAAPRVVLASLGKRSLDEVIGDLSLLKCRATPNPNVEKTTSLSPEVLLRGEIPESFDPHRNHAAHHVSGAHPELHGVPLKTLDDEILETPEVKELLSGSGAQQVTLTRDVKNTDRTVGGRIGGEIAAVKGADGLEGDGSSLTVIFTGTAGQSFGAFTMPGTTLTVEGDANDYVAKSMAGGVVEIRGHRHKEETSTPVVAGNTCLYGATGGKLFMRGAVGERFGVRNSGALGVVEGAGDHLAEYQTGGTLIVLGDTGKNIGSGMTGGIVFLVGTEDLDDKVNTEYVGYTPVQQDSAAAEFLRNTIAEHFERTGSSKAESLLANWAETLEKAVEVIPNGQTSPFASVVESDSLLGVRQR
eukprot:scaffold913_cov233-Pinguiococcus_pyrenoidosus.AAC.19